MPPPRSLDEIYELYREELGHACWLEHTRGTETPNDDFTIIPARVMRFIFEFTWRKAEAYYTGESHL